MEKCESEIKLVQYLPVCRVVKDCGQIANEIGDVRAATDEVARSKVKLGDTISDINILLIGLCREIASFPHPNLERADQEDRRDQPEPW